MKKLKMALMAIATLVGVGGALAFTKPTTGCGWKNTGTGWQQYPMGTQPGHYTCDASVNITCTFQDDLVTPCNTGTFKLH